MRDIINKLKQIEESQTEPSGPQVGDEFGLSFSDDLEISTTITDVLEDGIVVEMDDDALTHMTENGVHLYDGEITETEAQKGVDGKRCWKGYRRMGTKKKGGKTVDNCVKVGEGIEENVPIDKPQDRDNPRYDIARLLADLAKSISLKTDDGIKLSDDVEKLAMNIIDDKIVSGKDVQAYAKSAESDPKEIIKYFNMAVKKYKEGERFDRSAVKDPSDSDGYQGMESSELNRIRELSGIQKEDHGPEVDGFLKKVAAEGTDGYDMLHSAMMGKYGPKIDKAVSDMYNDVSVDSGLHPDDDFEDIYDRMMDQIEADYGSVTSEGRVKDMYLDMEADAAEMSREEFIKAHGESYAHVWDKVQGQMKGDPQYDESVRKLADAVMDEGASDSVNMAKLKQAVGGEEALVTTLHASAVQRGLDDDDFVDAAKRMLNMSSEEVQAIIDKNIKGEEPEKTKYSSDDLKDVRDKLASRTDALSKMGEKESLTSEAEYQGRKVSLGKPTRGDVKKFKVYVKNPKGNVVKVNFGDPNMKIKKSNPARRRSFRARHNCANPGPRHKARYWSCRKW